MGPDGRSMWFGTRGFMRWVKCPQTDADFSTVGWSSTFQYLSGGAAVRASTGSHKVYNMDWSIMSREQARDIADYAAGVYDTVTGTNLLYFIDPMAASANVLPQNWASPAQSASDGTTLVPGQSPEIITGSNFNNYPARYVQYTANASSSTVYIPIPPGFTAWVGFHGAVTGGGGVTITPSNGLINSTPVPATILDIFTATRVADSFDSTDFDGITLSLNNSGIASTDTTTIAGMVVQILKTGTAPATGGFISGQGHSGCQFAEKPLQTMLSSVRDQVALSATLIETGAWL